MPLAISLAPDLDGIEDLFGASDAGLQMYLAALAILLAIVVAHYLVDRFRQRSPVEKMLRRRGRA